MTKGQGSAPVGAVTATTADIVPVAGAPAAAGRTAAQPLVSFVIPCFNSAAYVDRAVAPLLAANERIEIVLVNDGSTDDTPALLDHYARWHPDRVISVHRDNGGHGAAMGTGITTTPPASTSRSSTAMTGPTRPLWAVTCSICGDGSKPVTAQTW
ncbi:glycosyltransferase [Brachybacterium sp. P6-10-X1]|uniref:glycosyltransferase family 2 protein n=1 Tax=Brachybacterium sp. P6-10-X1 TaxID=1903186 RepID=UPI0009F96BCF